MSSLWTPDGEHPVNQRRQTTPSAAAGPRADAASTPSPDTGPEDGKELDEAQIEALRSQLAQTPAAVVITNHCLGIWELAALHLSQQPPQLSEAAIAIDTLGAIVERLEGRLGDDEATVRDALAQLRLAFVQIKSASDAGDMEAGDA